MNEGERKEEEELEEEELYPPARWLKRQFYRIAIKRTCEKLRELEPQEAIRFLEEELRIAERQREFAFWQSEHILHHNRAARKPSHAVSL